MLFEKTELAKYKPEIIRLCKTELGETVPLNGLTYFGILSGNILQAIAAVRCYMGSWHMRADVVKPEYRGYGYQRKLIQERLAYLVKRTTLVRVYIHPRNMHSIRNYESERFEFEKLKKLDYGGIFLVYKKHISRV